MEEREVPDVKQKWRFELVERLSKPETLFKSKTFTFGNKIFLTESE